jgi:hypothetical protein
MITFNEIGKHGRLGNQLFQIAILKVISEKTKYQIALPQNTFDRTHHNQRNLLKYFKLPSINYTDFNPQNGYNEQSNWHFDPEIFNIPDNTNMYGYFQNAKYYNDYQNILIKEFEMVDSLENFATSYLSQFSGPTVSLHVRRGDYSDGSTPNGWTNNFNEGSILKKYYSAALSLIPKNSTIFLFTGGSRYNTTQQDYEWCMHYFNDKRIIFMQNFSDIQCFALMKSCTYNITSFVSSFTWWTAFLNKNNNVITPYNYFPGSNIKIENLCPKYWQLI